MKTNRMRVGIDTELALIEGMIEGGTPWPTVEEDLASFVATLIIKRLIFWLLDPHLGLACISRHQILLLLLLPVD